MKNVKDKKQRCRDNFLQLRGTIVIDETLRGDNTLGDDRFFYYRNI